MSNRIVSYTQQYMEPFNFDLYKNGLSEIVLCDHLTEYILTKAFTNHVFNTYVKTGFGIK